MITNVNELASAYAKLKIKVHVVKDGLEYDVTILAQKQFERICKDSKVPFKDEFIFYAERLKCKIHS